MAYTPDANMAVVYLCGVMFLSLSGHSTGAWALVNVVTPRHTVATVGALQNFGGFFGGSFAPVITGWLLEHTQSFKIALLMSAPVGFTAALLYLALVRKRSRRHRPYFWLCAGTRIPAKFSDRLSTISPFITVRLRWGSFKFLSKNKRI